MPYPNIITDSYSALYFTIRITTRVEVLKTNKYDAAPKSMEWNGTSGIES